jgi:phenylalanyl-tRNA synthetase beta chain
MPLLDNALLFDRYVGPQISGKAVGLTYSLTYRSLEKTLTDDEVNHIHQHHRTFTFPIGSGFTVRMRF